MPSAATLSSFVATAVVLCVVPGPNVVYIVSRTMAEGRRAGVASVLGLNSATVVHIGLAALGLSALLASSAVAYDVVRYAGAAYLVFLGVRALLRSRTGVGVGVVPDPAPRDAHAGAAYRQGFIVNLLNPKTGLFFLALLPQFVDPARGSTALQVVVLGLVLLSIGIANDSLYALGAGCTGLTPAPARWMAASQRAHQRARLHRSGARRSGRRRPPYDLTAAPPHATTCVHRPGRRSRTAVRIAPRPVQCRR